MRCFLRCFFLLVLALVIAVAAFAQRERVDRKLKRKLEALVQAFGDQGTVGIYVHHLKSGKTVSILADSIFPTASTIKIPLQVGIFNKLEKGGLQYHQELVYRDSLLYPGVDILGSFRDSQKIELSKVVMLMCTMSDNTASLWLQALAGGGQAINEWLEQNGFHHTRVNSRTPGREANRSQYGWGQTTPREMADLLTLIYQRKAVSPAASDRMFRNLSRNYWDTEGPSQFPPSVHVASKNGALNEYRSEVLLVSAPHGDFVYCAMINHLKDQSWVHENAAWVLLRKIAQTLWQHFEPKIPWIPPPGNERW